MDEVRKNRRALWNEVPNLHIVGDLVEAVRIRCRNAVIVMIHCHLSFQQIMSSVECERVLGVVSLPCCNYFEVQKQFMGQSPTFEYARRLLSSPDLPTKQSGARRIPSACG